MPAAQQPQTMTPQYIPRDYMDESIDAVFGEYYRGVLSTLLVMATGTGKTEAYLQIVERFLRENPRLRSLVLAHREELISQPARRWHRNHGEWPAIEMGELRADLAAERDLFDASPTNSRIVIASIPTLNSGKRCRKCTGDCAMCAGKGELPTACLSCDGAGRHARDDGQSGAKECCKCEGAGTVKVMCKTCQGDGWVCTKGECDACFEHVVRRMQKFKPEEFGLIVIDEAHHSVADTYARIIRYFRRGNPSVFLLGATATPDRADE